MDKNYKYWNRFYESQTHPYQDRHWLWEILPEIFPIPPAKSQGELYVKNYVCERCQKIYELPELCDHLPIYRSEIDLTAADLKHLHVEFAEADQDELDLLDIGCGTGSTCFPLLEKSGEYKVTAFDFSERAIEWLRAREYYDETRVNAFVDNALTFSIQQRFEEILLIFVLSSLKDYRIAILNAIKHLDESGVLNIVDYTYNDNKVTRREGSEVSEGILCSREDQTILIGFDTTRLKEWLLLQSICVYDCEIIERIETNRKTNFQFVRSHFVLKCGKTQFSKW